MLLIRCKNNIQCRRNQYTQVNVYGKHLSQLCKHSGMIISNGRFFMLNAPGISHTFLEEAKALPII